MTIDVLESPTRAVQESKGVNKARRLQQAQATPASNSDSVSLTRSAVTLQKLEQIVSTQPIVDQSKVENIKNAIAKGQYVMDPQKTADKFMKLESALTNNKSS